MYTQMISGTAASHTTGRTLEAVSYTHLDVYKRQLEDLANDAVNGAAVIRVSEHR